MGPEHRLLPQALRWLLMLLPLGLAACGPTQQATVPGSSSNPAVRLEFQAVADGLANSTILGFPPKDLSRLEAELTSSTLAPVDRVNKLATTAYAFLLNGDWLRAIERVEESVELARTIPSLTGKVADLWRLRGLAYLRLAEVKNCLERHNPDCCVFPLRGDGVHSLADPARKALRSFEKALLMRPDDLGLVWLLNITAMAIGIYPEGITDRYLIPPKAFESEQTIARFHDVAVEAGVANPDRAGGVITEDLDGDGHIDLLTTTVDPHGSASYHRVLPGMQFEDRTDGSGLSDQLGGLNCVAGDYDSDGDGDVLILRGAWMFEEGRIRNSLLRNDGKGHFVDVTMEAGLAVPARPTQTACFGDFDGDGDLDLYVGNESRREIGPPGGDYPSQLFLNDGAGHFRDEAEAAGVTNDRYAKGVAAGDYDNDGDLDIYVSNAGLNRLYRNRGDATFEDVAPELGVTEPDDRSFATWFFDYDNDGWLDLWVCGYSATTADIAAAYLGRKDDGERPRLYHNEGGRFRDVTSQLGLDHPYLPMGASFGDLDNDGWLDVYLGTGEPSYEAIVPNVMLRNDLGRRFLDVSTSGGFGHLQKGHGIAFADFDEDGDQDVFCQLGGFYPGDGFPDALFENPGGRNHFLKLSLIGRDSKHTNFGARVEVVVREDGCDRSIYRAVGSTSSFGSTPLRQEIGLGSATSIIEVRVGWPNQRGMQSFRSIPLDSWLRVHEGEENPQLVESSW